MATTTTIPAVKAAIVAQLAARSGLANVGVTYAWPGPSTKAEAIWLEGVVGQVRMPELVGTVRQSRHETYMVGLVVQVVQEGGAAETASVTEARLLALWSEVEQLFADNRGLGVDGVLDVKLGGEFTLEPPTPAQKGWSCRITAAVEVSAWLN